MVIPCNLPTPSDSPPYTAVGPHFPGAMDISHDIYFIVGTTRDTWTIPGQRDQLVGKCPALGMILRDGGREIRLEVDKRGFETFLRHLEGTPAKFTSTSTARSTLDISCRFQCQTLVGVCVEYLDLNLDVDNVLDVYKDLSTWCSNEHTFAPSAPPLGAEGLSNQGQIIQEWCSSLLHNCLIIIDENCTEIITKELFENLSYNDISTIISRETLNIKSEYILYESLIRWYRCQCMKKGPQNPTTGKEILGDLIFKIRFGLMAREEFLSGPAQAGIFTTNEVNEILSIIDTPSNLITSGVYRNINVKRKNNPLEVKFLSERTFPKNGKTKLKKDKKNGSSTLLNCLTVWTVLFD